MSPINRPDVLYTEQKVLNQTQDRTYETMTAQIHAEQVSDSTSRRVSGKVLGTEFALEVALVDASGAQITTFGGGTQYAEDAALGSTPTGTLTMARRDDALSTLTPVEDDAVSIRTNARGAVWMSIEDGAGGQITSFSGGTQYTEDAAAAANPVGTAVNLIRQDTPAALVTTDGDNVAQRGTNYGAGFVQVVTSAGAFVDTFGGGTQYADGAVRGTATGTIAMGDDGTNIQSIKVDTAGELQIDVLTMPTVAVTQSGTWDEVGINDSGNSITVDGTVAVTGVSTLAEQQTQTGHLATIAGDTTDIETAVELIDDTVYVDDADWTDNTSKHILVGGVYQSSPHTVTDGDVSPALMDVNGRLIVAAVQSGTWDEVGINDSGNVITVDGSGSAGTAAAGVVTVQGIASMTKLLVTPDSVALPANQSVNVNQVNGETVDVGAGTEAAAIRVTLPTNGTGVIAGVTTVTTVSTVSALGVSTTGPQKAEDVASAGGDMGIAIMTPRLDTPVANAAVSNDGDYTTPVLDNFRKLWVTGTVPEDTAHVAGEALTVQGSRRIETLATSSGNDADWSTVNQTAEGAAWTTPAPTTKSGLSIANFTSGDTYTALTSTAQVIKASAGKLYGYYIGNPNTVACWVLVYNTAAASVTVGTTTAIELFWIPAGSAANIERPIGTEYGTAMSCAAVMTTAGGNTAPTTALEVMIYYK